MTILLFLLLWSCGGSSPTAYDCDEFDPCDEVTSVGTIRAELESACNQWFLVRSDGEALAYTWLLSRSGGYSGIPSHYFLVAYDPALDWWADVQPRLYMPDGTERDDAAAARADLLQVDVDMGIDGLDDTPFSVALRVAERIVVAHDGGTWRTSDVSALVPDFQCLKGGN